LGPKGKEESNPKSKVLNIKFGSIEIKLQGWVLGDLYLDPKFRREGQGGGQNSLFIFFKM
jgi:hypothetical protein